ncbi:FtsK/SpoIIIE domain-containing protein [Arthrobacter sp. ZGTC412]|uniref:FtsK/SpoIIIE domain-containing protein n=1 Tax=Arthrobacter sp. ZGTC412 TaxID=2058900 RepID=UPI000CE4B86B|nr:FtsK/SpoIIIE domain-containing protein [Arthrobacter sp. ZGTC412]
MKFHCTLVRSTGSGMQESPSELTINAPEGTAGAVVHAQLIQEFGTGPITIHGKDIHSMTVGEAPLVNGAVLVDGVYERNARKFRPRAPAEDAQLALAVHTGIGAGTVVPLRRGSYTIGRSGTRIVIPDPELSREHARLVVTETDIMIIDLDSANGIHVDGERVRNAVISTKSSITCGNTTMSLVFVDLTDKALADAGTSTQLPLTLPGRMDTGNKAVLLLTAVLPLLIGIGLAVLNGMWMFLAFAATSAVSVLVPLASGRRQRRDLTRAVAAAVAEDRERRRRSGPSLAILALAVSQRQGPTSVSSGEEGVWLRVGEAPQPANVRVEPAVSSVGIPSVGAVPVFLDPGMPRTTLRGPSAVADGIVRSFVMQLAGYPRGHGTRVVIHGEAARLPLGARYLPGVILTASASDLLRILNEGFGRSYQRGVLLLLPTSDAGDDDGAVCVTAAALGWQVLEFPAAEVNGGTCVVELAERKSLLRLPARDVAFVPDLAPEDVFLSFCRHLAVHAERRDNDDPAVPAVCSLQDVLPLAPHQTAARWNASARDHRLNIPLGMGATGTRTMDLQSDGPHLLVAGTTGSGKSELLRSLTLALALCHPPERVNFLFVDFKGGSGLGPLAELVHCVGLLTDLSAYEIERALTSLRAEVRLREEALASARVPDLTAYRHTRASQDFPLPHLVIVIDEFRMLVDDAPEALRELMRLAAIGRSLGIHLVMATQRPQGALTADIRANVTSSIALRVQSEMESSDIINSKVAAGISVEAPGRAFLARGTEAPLEFQTASIGPAQAGSSPADAVKVQLAADCLAFTGFGGADIRRPTGQTPAQAARPLVAMVRDLWRERKGAAPRRPVAPPLPSNLAAPQEETPSSPTLHRSAAWSIRLGLLDLPEKQRVVPLEWKPAEDSHLALIGAPSSGATEALELAVMQLLLSPSEAHGYILDAGGTFLNLATHPNIGAHAGLHELRRAVRVLERLKKELARRLSQTGKRDGVPLVLVISGWGSWISAFRAGPLAWAEDLVQDLARDGGAAGIIVMIAGDRELVSSRAFSALPNRLYFPTGSNTDSRIAWPRMPATAEIKGRAVAFGPVSRGMPAVCQLYCVSLHHSWHSGPTARLGSQEILESADSVGSQPTKRPFRVEQLPALVPAAKMRPTARSAAMAQPLVDRGQPIARGSTTRQDILVGVGGDELKPASCRLQGAGVLTVLGGPGSGKTNLLRALPLMNPDAGPWLSPEEGTDPYDFWKRELATAAAGETPEGTVALADDADLLSAETIRNLTDLNALGYPVILTATYSSLLIQRVPLVMSSRSAGTGLLLAPRSLSDGDLFGVRFEVEANAPPGRGILICQGISRSIQVGWAAPGEGA